jgi:hypothetical protein
MANPTPTTSRGVTYGVIGVLLAAVLLLLGFLFRFPW